MSTSYTGQSEFSFMSGADSNMSEALARNWWAMALRGVLAIVFGVIAIFYLTDWPRQAKWLRDDEREWVAAQLSEEQQAKQSAHRFTITEALRHRDVILLTLCYFFALTGNYGLAFWLPTIFKRLSGQSDFRVTLLASLPFLAGFLVQQVNGWHSDRTGERRWHAAVPLLLSGVSLVLTVLYGSDPSLSVGFFTLVGAFYFAYHPAFWALPSMFLGESAAAASIGLINSVGNLGGFVGPMLMGYLVTRTRSFSVGLLFLAGSLCVSGMLMLAVGAGRRRAIPEISATLPAPAQ